MALSAPNTPRATPKRLKTYTIPPQTPECYNTVTVETPISNKRRSNNTSNDKFDEISNLKVAVRIRPMNVRELNVVGATDLVKVDGQNLIIRTNSLTNYNLNMDHLFQYDHIFWSCDENKQHFSSQEDVFNAIGKPLLNNAFCGYNACLFAYGQTGSGKSYSMMGRYMDDIDQNSGITPRFCKKLFDKIAQLPSNASASVEVSYFEIYNEKIHDLLTNNHSNNIKQPLKVREHPVWGPYVVDLTTHVVKSYKELRNWMMIGNKNRATAATVMNEISSRSHSIFAIELNLLEGGSEDEDSGRRSKVSLVDLAGSERLNNSGNNEERLRQGVCINKSLLTLGKVISALAEHKKSQQFIPYRDSVLTWLLRESLGGNSLTCMLATITPASCNIEETLATLRYACQARSIVNRARVNENPHDRLIRELRAEVERLRTLRQDYERQTLSSSDLLSTSGILRMDDDSNSIEQEKQLDELRNKLSKTENELRLAEVNWEKRFLETQEKQMKELEKAEKRKEELESHLRIMKTKDTHVKLSPYKTNFLQQLENVLTVEEENNKKLNKINVGKSMNQIYDIMATFQPLLKGESDQLLFARINKLLQALETTLNNNVNDRTKTNKVVTFKL